MRAFIAIELDRPIKEALIGLIRELRATRADVRWAAPSGMHLTLKFLGPIDEGQVLRVKDVMVRTTGRYKAFPLKLEGTGAFPGEQNPRVLWVGIVAAAELTALQADLDTALEAEGFQRERRDFRPHLTLGRVKGPDRLPLAVTELAKHRGETFGSMVATRISLFESLLHPEGAEYRTVFEAPLS